MNKKCRFTSDSADVNYYTIMKKLVLSLALVAFAMASIQAGEAKKTDACCADKAKVVAKAGCGDKCFDEKVVKRIDMSVKGATLLAKK